MHRPILSSFRHEAAQRRARSAGFTLIEIMAVVVIMGMLMATLAVGINSQIKKAQLTNAKNQILRIEQALEFYQLDNARFPNADQGLQALVTRPTAPPEPRSYNPAGYIKAEALVDPWDQPFQYRIPGDHNPQSFDIWSLGPDGVESGDDIANWSTTEDIG
jgi:general secretion pathway protein G